MRLIIIYFLFINILFGDVFQPNGTHCSDYSYQDTTAKATDYVATAMKTNETLTLTKISFTGVANFNFLDAQSVNFKVELREGIAGAEGTLEPRGTLIKSLGEITDDSANKKFVFTPNVTINKGTTFFLKLIPIAPVYNSSNYTFTAKECWCDATNLMKMEIYN